jgi:septal ring factor EnvC (AmiA/AmiB activator)
MAEQTEPARGNPIVQRARLHAARVGAARDGMLGVALCFVAVCFVAFCSVASGETALRAEKSVETEHVETGSSTEPVLSDRKLELHGVQEAIEAAKSQGRKLEAEIASIRDDRAKLAARLVETAEAASAIESRIAEKEKRLNTLLEGESSIKSSLSRQRGVIAEVLAALQRMGRKPPPALLASPDDILRTIRTAMLLGAVVPDLQADVETLRADLADLESMRRAIATERASLAEDAERLKSEREQIAVLVEARQSALNVAEKALGAEQRRMVDLGRRSADLGDLIGKMETEIEAAARAAAAAREADVQRKAREKDQHPGPSLGSPFADPARLAPAVAFVDAKGMLPLPVSGTVLRGYGYKDGFGGTEKGMLIGTRAGAFVSSPCDGWVSYAGPYRGYGQLLIVNAGQGYYIILAGMDRINVNVGQFVLAGEPVALMGDRPTRMASALAAGVAQPTLYVEFRKDGTAIDPGPWWAKAELQKVRG